MAGIPQGPVPIKEVQNGSPNMKLPLHKFNYRFITILYMSLIVYSSLQPEVSRHSNQVSRAIHNFLHIPVYALLAYFLLKCFSKTSPKTFIFAFSIAFLFGVINEMIQGHVPGRSSSVTDALLNGIGIILALIIKMGTDSKGALSPFLKKDNTKWKH